ncbi:MAG: DNA replication and repair protein RecF [Bacteroidales bacterium]|nr:DNA replication and repair protein RecF [Bacteroidales bacterium]
MPVLKKIAVQDFRNIAFQELSFSPNVNCISGNNGEGKTNLMDAIWYLSMTKSAFSSSDRFNFRHGTDSFTIAGTYSMGPFDRFQEPAGEPAGPGSLPVRFSVQVDSKGEKKVRRDDKPYIRISEHIGVLPIVMVSPSDISLVSESGDERRRFVNSVLSQMDREYLSAMQQYNRLLTQRNRMLKDGNFDDGLLSIFDERMDSQARIIFKAREYFIKDLLPVVSEYYSILSGGRETVSIGYQSDVAKGSLADILAASREKDIALRYTTAGIQRDDFIFRMDGYPIRRCGSQGQQKSFLVSLKFAQYEVMKQGYGFPPMLLLDDVFDKLDMGRIANLLGMVAGSDFGQIFITDSNKVRMSGIVDTLTADRAYFEAVGGEFREVRDA